MSPAKRKVAAVCADPGCGRSFLKLADDADPLCDDCRNYIDAVKELPPREGQEE